MPKFSFEKIINTNRDDVYEIFSNYENYEKLIPQHFPSIRVRSVRGDVSVVEERLMLGNTELLIMAKHVLKKPVFHQIFVIGGDAKGSQIRQEFIRLENGTKILVDVDLKFKGKMKISSIFRKNDFKSDYAKILNDFVKLAEN
ncbi:MAG: SRPBCC family protein [Nitrosopumilus sp.]